MPKRKERIAEWAKFIGANVKQVREVWEDLKRRGLAKEEGDRIFISPLAMRRSISDIQRRLASYLSGYLLTENSYIVRKAGNPPGKPQILNTRIFVEYIANYFKEGWGVLEIQKEFPFLTREEIEAAIQYYLNHREEIERGMRESEEIYERLAPKGEAVGV